MWLDTFIIRPGIYILVIIFRCAVSMFFQLYVIKYEMLDNQTSYIDNIQMLYLFHFYYI